MERILSSEIKTKKILKILDGEVVDIKVIFYGVETTATFDATIFGYNVS